MLAGSHQAFDSIPGGFAPGSSGEPSVCQLMGSRYLEVIGLVPVVVSVAVMALAKIAVAVTVPVMVVFSPAAIALPVPIKEALSIVVGGNPAGTGIDWTSPVPGMPLVVVPHRVPISLHPNEFRAWTGR